MFIMGIEIYICLPNLIEIGGQVSAEIWR